MEANFTSVDLIVLGQIFEMWHIFSLPNTMTNLRLVLTIAVPSVTALIGILFYLGRKRGKEEGKGRKERKEIVKDGLTKSEDVLILKSAHQHPQYGQGDAPDVELRSRFTESQNTTDQVSRNRERDKCNSDDWRDPDVIKEEVESLCLQSTSRPTHRVDEETEVPEDSRRKFAFINSDTVTESDSPVGTPTEEHVVVCDEVVCDDLSKDSSESSLDDVLGNVEEPAEYCSQTAVHLSRSPGSASVHNLDSLVSIEKTSVASSITCSQESDGAISRDSLVSSASSDDQKSLFSQTDSIPQTEASLTSVSEPPSVNSSSAVTQSSSPTKPNESVISTSVSNSTNCTISVTKVTNCDNDDSQTSLAMDQTSCNGTSNEVSSISVSLDKPVSAENGSHDVHHGRKIASVSGAAEAVRVENRVCDDNSGAAVAAPSESPGCDSNSEASNDSGRGGSVTEPIPLPIIPPDTIRYEFNFPSDLCGRLIGKNGRNINLVKEKSGANIALKNNPCTPNFQICVIEGSQMEVDKALVQIRRKFPRSQFPQVDFTPLTQVVQEAPVLMPDIMQLNLPEGVSVDIVVSNIVDAGHIFVQQPTHPTFPSLERLNQFMMACYTQDHMVPPLPRPIEVGVICAAYNTDGWFRTQVVNVCDNSDEVDVKYVDYGGYARIQSSMLKQIRSDFMTLPFQAVECYMGNTTPLQEEEYFSERASSVLEELTQGTLLQAQVVNRAEDGIPYIHIYQISGNRVLFINREMVNRKVVRWIEILQ